MGKKKDRAKKGQVKSQKKAKNHVMDQLQYTSGKQEKMANKLIIEFLHNHLPKIMDIVPKEVREARGETYKPSGKLFNQYITSLETKNKYVKTAKTIIKYLVINHKEISSFGDIEKKHIKGMFSLIADNIGEEKGQYSKKTYDGYVESYAKLMGALAAKPEDAKVQIEGRQYAPPVQNIVEKGFAEKKYKQHIRDMIDDYSMDDYKRGKEGGYRIDQSLTIMRQAEKHLGVKEQLLVSLYVHGALRNAEGLAVKEECFDEKTNKLNLLLPNMNKHNRARVVSKVHDTVFEKFNAYKNSSEYVPNARIFEGWDADKARELVQECCRLGKISYSGVHDLRKSFVNKLERDLQKDILKGKLTKEDLVNEIMDQVSADPRLNPTVKKKEWVPKRDKSGKVYGYYSRNKKDGNGNYITGPKFVREELMNMNIENVLDYFVAQEIGHNDPETTAYYRSEEAKERRRNFRQSCRDLRKNGKL